MSRRGYEAIQGIHGVGRVVAKMLVAEHRDVGRFRSARHLADADSASSPSRDACSPWDVRSIERTRQRRPLTGERPTS
jgi:Transposase IS116/IS110/IS902 family